MTNELFGKSNTIIFNKSNDVNNINIITKNNNFTIFDKDDCINNIHDRPNDSNFIDNKFLFSDTNETNIDKNFENNNIDINIYRYKFSNEFTQILFDFSKVHQYKNRKDYQEAWNIWLKENDNIISKENERLINLGYNGDVLDKMFKSSRYYFSKKTIEKKSPTLRNNYIKVQKKFLYAIDDHIKNQIIKEEDFKPSEGFNNFCLKNFDLLKIEVNELLNNGFKNNSEEIKKKIKKTYKNRYFLIIKKEKKF